MAPTDRSNVSLYLFFGLAVSVLIALYYFFDLHNSLFSRVNYDHSSFDFTSTLFISGVPDNNFNFFANIFALNLATGEVNRISGFESEASFSTGYIYNLLSGNRFVLLRAEPLKGLESLVIPVVVQPGTPFESSQNDSIPFKQEVLQLDVKTGLLSNSLTVTSDATRLAFVSHFPDGSTVKASISPDMRRFSTWTVATISATDSGNLNHYFNQAKNPVFATDDHLIFMREEAIYIHDFIADSTSVLVEASALSIPAFSPQDSIAVVGSPNNPILLVYKHDSRELITLASFTQVGPKTAQNIVVTDRSLLNGIDGRVVYQLLTLTPTRVATLHIDPSDESVPDIIALYDISTGAPVLVRTYSMEGVTLPGTTMIDSWTPTLIR